jgi:hypothetical protein
MPDLPRARKLGANGHVTRLKWPATIITLAAELPSIELTPSDFTYLNGLRGRSSGWAHAGKRG